MPSVGRFAFLREAMRNHPVIVSTSAATAGVLLGGFVAVQLLATPKPLSDSAGTGRVAVEAKAAAPKSAAETSGSAPTGENVASSDCEQQTWPYLSQVCMEEFRSKNRSARVVTTDKLDKPTITATETQPAVPAAPAASPSQSESSVPAAVAVAAPPAAAEPPKSASTPPANAPAATPQPPVPAPAAQAAEASLPPSAKNEAKEKRVAQKSIKKSTRKLKVERRAPAKQDMDDDDSTVASVDSDNAFSDDRGSYRRVDRHPDGRSDRSRRIVERWTERDYDVPDSRGGRRQVTVIRPDHGGGLFESLFGN